jgi:hypothetical protein
MNNPTLFENVRFAALPKSKPIPEAPAAPRMPRVGLRDEGFHLFLDEPDNYVALREIQPWLSALTDSCGEGVEQAFLISHHPEIIDHLALSSGRWFERDSNGPARVSEKPKAQVDGLKPSESVARGWESRARMRSSLWCSAKTSRRSVLYVAFW